MGLGVGLSLIGHVVVSRPGHDSGRRRGSKTKSRRAKVKPPGGGSAGTKVLPEPREIRVRSA